MSHRVEQAREVENSSYNNIFPWKLTVHIAFTFSHFFMKGSVSDISSADVWFRWSTRGIFYDFGGHKSDQFFILHSLVSVEMNLFPLRAFLAVIIRLPSNSRLVSAVGTNKNSALLILESPTCACPYSQHGLRKYLASWLYETDSGHLCFYSPSDWIV